MARIFGIDIPDNKRVEVSLTYIHGVGRVVSRHVLGEAGVDINTRVKDLTSVELNNIREIIEKNYKVEGALRQERFQNIKRLKDIKCYKGIRHKIGLPVRGQRTRCNARTRKGRNLPVGGLKRILQKT